MERVELPVKGMTCHHCVMTVTQALNSVEGVRAAEVNLEGAWAKVTFDPTKASRADLARAVQTAGYQVE
ncbi:MAG: heavy metal-binding domain-containing protein [Sulfobacillus thermosulfidooxidans]|uniref:Copper chaperone CopZ n=1 Tax=Sulfobacillus thermosulfidooxidans TaxID=28034 RepID=A0A2T2WGU6_SULTH|nr:MAG: heavy metal-binding domain-containing protein [Sulfobacillus thermosulfidooxidans]